MISAWAWRDDGSVVEEMRHQSCGRTQLLLHPKLGQVWSSASHASVTRPAQAEIFHGVDPQSPKLVEMIDQCRACLITIGLVQPSNRDIPRSPQSK